MVDKRKLSEKEKDELLKKTTAAMIKEILEKANIVIPENVFEKIINVAVLISSVQEITVTVPNAIPK
ncbi:MAG: hypothetical protein IB617_03155 [Candidatus Nealsonbacteria bacterium]|nr:MAG: hypothetical protein IB617_03155 [Candidatus Nealsonbacteria bacterium]